MLLLSPIWEQFSLPDVFLTLGYASDNTGLNTQFDSSKSMRDQQMSGVWEQNATAKSLCHFITLKSKLKPNRKNVVFRVKGKLGGKEKEGQRRLRIIIWET